jgi:hypothetical protein
MRKGQVEFIAVVVLVIIGAIVVLYTYQTGLLTPPPAGVADEQASVRNTVVNFVREAAYYTIKDISLNGGFREEQTNSLTFRGKQVNYWLYKGEKTIPDVGKNFVRGVEHYLNRNREALASSLKGKNVSIGEATVSANILNNKIKLAVSMPVTVKGYPLQQPFNVEVETKLGEVVDFSEELIGFQTENSFFEYSTLFNVMQPVDGFETGLWYKIITGCTQFSKDWNDVKPLMEGVIRVTLAHVYMPGKAPLGIADKSSYLKHLIPAFENKKYSDLSVSFHLPDGFELDRGDFSFNPEPISVNSERLKSGICKPESVYIRYNLTYPVVVLVEDPYTRNLFRFAFDTYITDNMPAGYPEFGAVKSLQAEVCEKLDCMVTVTVSGSGGVEGASVSFRGCKLGETDKDGFFSGYSPCGLGAFEVRKTGYGSFSDIRNVNQLQDAEIKLKKLVPVNLFFYEVAVRNTSDSYFIPSKNSVKPVSGKSVIMEFRDAASGETVLQSTFDKQGELVEIPEGTYLISGMLTDTVGDKVSVQSQFLYRFEVGPDIKYLYIYLPKMGGFGFTEEENPTIIKMMPLAVELSNVLKECGIGPVSTEKFTLTKALVYYKDTGRCS